MVYPSIDRLGTGRAIHLARLSHNTSVEALQEYLQLTSPRVIYQWQKGICLPSLDHFYAISELWDLSINSMIIRADQSLPPE